MTTESLGPDDEDREQPEFLKAEEQAFQLLEQLNRLKEEIERLKEEIESYDSSRRAIEEAGSGIVGAAGILAKLAGKTSAVIEQLLSIGTPEIIERLRKLEQRAKEDGGKLSDLAEIVAPLKDLDRRSKEAHGKLSNLATTEQMEGVLLKTEMTLNLELRKLSEKIDKKRGFHF